MVMVTKKVEGLDQSMGVGIVQERKKEQNFQGYQFTKAWIIFSATELNWSPREEKTYADSI
jgi:hypothetical protein